MVNSGDKQIEVSFEAYLLIIKQVALAVQAEAKALRQFTLELELELLMDKHLANVAAGGRELGSLLGILVLCSISNHQQFVSLN